MLSEYAQGVIRTGLWRHQSKLVSMCLCKHATDGAMAVEHVAASTSGCTCLPCCSDLRGSCGVALPPASGAAAPKCGALTTCAHNVCACASGSCPRGVCPISYCCYACGAPGDLTYTPCCCWAYPLFTLKFTREPVSMQRLWTASVRTVRQALTGGGDDDAAAEAGGGSGRADALSKFNDMVAMLSASELYDNDAASKREDAAKAPTQQSMGAGGGAAAEPKFEPVSALCWSAPAAALAGLPCCWCCF